MRKISAAGLQLIKAFEGCRLKAYRDPVGIPTIGYGRIKGVKMGDVISQEQADNWLLEEIENEYAPGVEGLVKVEITDNQFAALVSFAYNLGVGALAKSTLLRKLNAGDYAGASQEFGKWSKAGGKTLPGLVRRRAAESTLFLKEGE